MDAGDYKLTELPPQPPQPQTDQAARAPRLHSEIVARGPARREPPAIGSRPLRRL